MKTIVTVGLWILLMGAAMQCAFGQVAEHRTASNWQLGLRDGYGNGNLLQHRNNLQLHVGYYVTDRLIVGAIGSWSKEWVSQFSIHDLSIGPFARYYFTNTRLAPFLEANHQFGKRSSGEVSAIKYPGVSSQFSQISPGLSFWAGEAIRVEVSYAFQWLHLSRETQYFGQPQLGLAYVFSK